MGDLISREALLEEIKKDLKEKDTSGNTAPFITGLIYRQFDIEKIIEEQPQVEAVPKSYAEQIRWERDVAVGQLNEIGCQFGQKMDEVKDKLNSAKNWIPCSERLPEESGEYLVWYDCGEDMEGCCVENFDAGVGAFGRWCDEYDAHTLGFLDSEFIYFDEAVAWMPLPEPYKGE